AHPPGIRPRRRPRGRAPTSHAAAAQTPPVVLDGPGRRNGGPGTRTRPGQARPGGPGSRPPPAAPGTPAPGHTHRRPVGSDTPTARRPSTRPPPHALPGHRDRDQFVVKQPEPTIPVVKVSTTGGDVPS